MFVTRQLRTQIATLEGKNRALENLVQELAGRAGIDDAELLRLRREILPQVPEECRRLVAEDRIIEAIKVYREQTGAGLVQAKNAIDEYRAAQR
jgi:ribosomal protein L7/L12